MIKYCDNQTCNKILTIEDFPYNYRCFVNLCKKCKLKAQYILFKGNKNSNSHSLNKERSNHEF